MRTKIEKIREGRRSAGGEEVWAGRKVGGEDMGPRKHNAKKKVAIGTGKCKRRSSCAGRWALWGDSKEHKRKRHSYTVTKKA